MSTTCDIAGDIAVILLEFINVKLTNSNCEVIRYFRQISFRSIRETACFQVHSNIYISNLHDGASVEISDLAA